MNSLTPLAQVALVGLTLSSCPLFANGKRWTFINPNKGPKDTWYIVIFKESKGKVEVFDQATDLGDACDFDKRGVPAHGPARERVERIIQVAPNSRLDLKFGPADDDKAGAFKIVFSLCDRNWEDGGSPYLEDDSKAAAPRKLSGEEGGGGIPGDEDVVGIMGGSFRQITFHQPTWFNLNLSFGGSIAASLGKRLKPGEGCALSELALVIETIATADQALAGTPKARVTAADADPFDWPLDPTPRAKKPRRKGSDERKSSVFSAIAPAATED